MAFTKINLPKSKKLQLLSTELLTSTVHGMLKELNSYKYENAEDYQCTVSDLLDYIESAETEERSRSDMRQIDAPIAAAINLNNCSFLFSEDEISEIIESHTEESINIEYDHKHGWLPVLDKGYTTFFVTDVH